ncbi:hypothetical protein XBFM1_2250005 [Xenorhabdus bovienii str. feltiae Moldova]|uniref:Uncharacterized protein n=1 Tax=Xenorhabdus bovienii str. feltiae Moldova TaxID=1398200 RepID=A0A077NS51_XENBV|nr:hypothetical protein XBFM1_2250005 [Xenorhabdus bovienii str. feltiae Moldova]
MLYWFRKNNQYVAGNMAFYPATLNNNLKHLEYSFLYYNLSMKLKYQFYSINN